MTVVITIIVVVAVLVLAGLAWQVARRRSLQRRFGPEYQRVVAEQPNRAEAEHELRAREQRHSELDLRELSPQDRQRYAEQWTQVQALFVEDPARAVSSADELVTRVMHDRGYPLGDFDDRVRALSVEHAHTLDQYRQGPTRYRKPTNAVRPAPSNSARDSCTTGRSPPGCSAPATRPPAAPQPTTSTPKGRLDDRQTGDDRPPDDPVAQPGPHSGR